MGADLVIHPAAGRRSATEADQFPARKVEVRAVRIQRLEHPHRAGHPLAVRLRPVDLLEGFRQDEVQVSVGFGRHTGPGMTGR